MMAAFGGAFFTYFILQSACQRLRVELFRPAFKYIFIVSYIDVPEFVLRDCPLCQRTAVLVAKGCHERCYRIYCEGLAAKPHPTCSRQTAWVHLPELAEKEWNSQHDVPLPLFPDAPVMESNAEHAQYVMPLDCG